jgi:carbon storage regulator
MTGGAGGSVKDDVCRQAPVVGDCHSTPERESAQNDLFRPCHLNRGKGVQVMLVLSRKVNEEIVIANNVTIKVVKIIGNRVRLGISAPRSVNIRRGEMTPPMMESIDVPLDEFDFDAAEMTAR